MLHFSKFIMKKIITKMGIKSVRIRKNLKCWSSDLEYTVEKFNGFIYCLFFQYSKFI
jgi:hypothetical protein